MHGKRFRLIFLGLTVVALSAVPFRGEAFRGNAPFWQRSWLLLLAGAVGGPGNSDGPGTTATFNYPTGLVFGSSGNLIVADAFSDTIRQVTTGGVVSTYTGTAGGGNTNGPLASALFYTPTGVVYDSSWNLFIADSGNGLIRKITPGGVVSTFAGDGLGNSNDGTGTGASFYNPSAIAVDASDNLYVSDTSNNMIRKITPGAVVTTLAGNTTAGYTDATGTAAAFSGPLGIVVDSSGNIFVADAGNNLIRKITSGGVVTTFAGTVAGGNANGTGTAASFVYPVGLARDSSNNLYVADQNNDLIRKITPAQVVTTFAGSGSDGSTDATGTAASFSFPYGVAVDGSNNVFVSDYYGHLIRKITPAGVVSTLAGAGRFGTLAGTGAAARMDGINHVGVDSSGNLFTFSTNSSTLHKITPNGVVTTFAGSGAPGAANGTGVAASFDNALGITVFPPSTIYIADTNNHLIRKSTAAAVVTTYAGGAGVPGSTNATGTAARFNLPAGVTADSAGILYVADSGNNMIRKITTGKVVTTLAGNTTAGYADATGTAAQFNDPRGIAVDTSGVVYVADSGNNVIRKITAGVVTTLAGQAGVAGFADGTGTAATFFYPNDIAVDSSGNLYVSDLYNFAIRKITPSGVVTTVVGSHNSFHTVTGTNLPGSLSTPLGVALFGNMLYISVANGIVWTKKP